MKRTTIVSPRLFATWAISDLEELHGVQGSRACAVKGWKLLLPWAVLPVALAIVTAVEWLRLTQRPARSPGPAPRRQTATGGRT